MYICMCVCLHACACVPIHSLCTHAGINGYSECAYNHPQHSDMLCFYTHLDMSMRSALCKHKLACMHTYVHMRSISNARSTVPSTPNIPNDSVSALTETERERERERE